MFYIRKFLYLILRGSNPWLARATSTFKDNTKTPIKRIKKPKTEKTLFFSVPRDRLKIFPELKCRLSLNKILGVMPINFKEPIRSPFKHRKDLKSGPPPERNFFSKKDLETTLKKKDRFRWFFFFKVVSKSFLLKVSKK